MSQRAQHTILCREGEADTVTSAERLPTFRRNVLPSFRSVKWLKTNDHRLQPTRPDCCDAVDTCIGNVIWFASKRIIGTGLRKVQNCEILSRVLTVVSAFNMLIGHYTYRTVVTIRTAKRSLYVPHSDHYTYRKAVTIRSAQLSICVPHSGHHIYSPVVTICTTSLTFNNSTFCPHSVFMCFVWI